MDRRNFLSRLAISAGAAALLPAARTFGKFTTAENPVFSSRVVTIDGLRIQPFRAHARRVVARAYDDAFDEHLFKQLSAGHS